MSIRDVKVKKIICWLSIPGFLCIFGCATVKIRDDVFSPSGGKYTINISVKEWEPVDADKADIALWNKQYKAMFAIISSNIENKRLSLEMLRRHLFIGIADRKIVSKDSVLVDNQRALHTILEGEMDNCRLKIDAYVIRMGEKIYDLVCWAPSDSFDHIQGDFEDMIRSFHFTGAN